MAPFIRPHNSKGNSPSACSVSVASTPASGDDPLPQRHAASFRPETMVLERSGFLPLALPPTCSRFRTDRPYDQVGAHPAYDVRDSDLLLFGIRIWKDGWRDLGVLLPPVVL